MSGAAPSSSPSPTALGAVPAPTTTPSVARLIGVHILPFAAVFITPTLALVAYSQEGFAAWTPVWVLFGIVPVLDHLSGINRENPLLPPRISRALASLALIAAPVMFGVMLLGVRQVALSVGAAAWWDVLGWTISAGISGGISIQVAHELMHRPGRIEQRAADLLMLGTCYPHFSIEHVQGHHKHVSTPGDPASSRKGESLYQFLPRTVIWGLRSAWQIELRRSGSWWNNRMVAYALAQLVLIGAIGLAWGMLAVVAFFAQAIVAIGLLEVVNYIEHYGLSRPAKQVTRPDGVVETSYGRVLPQHSWNASHRVSNWLLLNLARHSDHHAFAARPYPELRHYEDVPQFPTGYAGMVLLALVPPVWFRLMDPRVDAIQR